MTEPVKGQKVRVTWTTTIEGIYDGVHESGDHRIFVYEVEGKAGHGRYAPASANIVVLLHDEPAPGCIVVDKHGEAWQNSAGPKCYHPGTPWITVGVDEQDSALDWAGLNHCFGPIKQVW